MNYTIKGQKQRTGHLERESYSQFKSFQDSTEPDDGAFSSKLSHSDQQSQNLWISPVEGTCVECSVNKTAKQPNYLLIQAKLHNNSSNIQLLLEHSIKLATVGGHRTLRDRGKELQGMCGGNGLRKHLSALPRKPDLKLHSGCSFLFTRF